MNFIIFIITLAAEALTTVAVVFSILFPEQRIWPPNERNAWGKLAMLILFNLTAVGVILLGILDWGSYIIPTWMQIAIGLPLWLTGNFLAVWAVTALGLARTSGKANMLIRRGPYRFSRNPQYLGFMLGLVGWALLANSALTIVNALAALPALIFVPFAEEPWLQVRYGKEYETYYREVPRFLAIKP
jgi:protein-S-isoprenylcysteine O-methyltransferase Ste14